jgi:hypothetical protein
MKPVKKKQSKSKRIKIIFDEPIQLANGTIVKEIMATTQDLPPGKPTGG